MRVRVRSLMIATLVISSVSCNETFESSYSSFEEARKADAGHGWLPSFLPADARDIHEVHDMDLNEVWGTFTTAEDARMPFCKNATRVVSVDVIKPSVSWWPRELAGNLQSGGDWVFYKCSVSDAALIAPSSSGPRYYWYLPRSSTRY